MLKFTAKSADTLKLIAFNDAKWDVHTFAWTKLTFYLHNINLKFTLIGKKNKCIQWQNGSKTERKSYGERQSQHGD